MSDTNVGMGIVPHRKNCRCLECECDKWAAAYRDAKQESQALTTQLAEARAERDALRGKNEGLRHAMYTLLESLQANIQEPSHLATVLEKPINEAWDAAKLNSGEGGKK